MSGAQRQARHDESQPDFVRHSRSDDRQRAIAGRRRPRTRTVRPGADLLRGHHVERQLPTILDATFNATATNPLVRLEPIDSVTRVIDDTIGGTGATTANTVPAKQAFPGTTATQLNTSATPLQLGDLVAYVSTPGQLFTVNPFTGQPQSWITNQDPTLGLPLSFGSTVTQEYQDIAMRSDGRLMTFSQGLGSNFTASTNGQYYELKPSDGTTNAVVGGLGVQASAIATSGVDPTNPINVTSGAFAYSSTGTDTGVAFNGMTFGYDPNFALAELNPDGTTTTRSLFAVGDRSQGNGISQWQNLLFGLNPDTGAPLFPDSQIEANATAGDPNGPFTYYQPFPGSPEEAGPGTAVTPNGALTTGVNIIAIPATDPTTSTNDLVDGEQIRVGRATAPSQGTVFTFSSGPTLNFPTTADGAYSQTPALNLVSGSSSFTIAGNTFTFTTGAAVGGVPILYSPADSPATLGAEIVAAVNATPGLSGVASFAVHRVTFNDYFGVSFAGMSGTGFTSATPLSPPANAIHFAAGDSAATIASAIATAINNANVPLPDSVVDGAVLANAYSGTIVAQVVSNTGGSFVKLGTGFKSGGVGTVTGFGLTGADLNMNVKNTNVTSANPAGPLVTDSPESNVYGPTDASIFGTRFKGNFFSQSGDITGIALVPTPNDPVSGAVNPDRMFAVSDSGAIYQVTNFNGFDQAQLTLLNIVSDPNAGSGVGSRVDFTGLSVGPPDVQNGQYKYTLFATDVSGNIWTIDASTNTATMGQLKGGFLDGATHVSTGLGDITGLTFSSLDFNLWHATTTNGGDPGNPGDPQYAASAGHGDSASYDFNASRVGQEPAGGGSFYFGLEDNSASQPQSSNYASTLDAGKFGNATLLNSYNLPGGALGSLQTQSFNLSGYTAADKPTVYFDYSIDTQDANAATSQAMRDSFRVYASSDGANWTELATNNSVLSHVGTTDAELPTFPTVSGGTYQGDKANQQTQEIFDQPGNIPTTTTDPNTTSVGWRQARVDLGDFAGKSNVTLRFDFSSAGSMGIGNTTQGGVYLAGIAGNQLQDGQSFTLDNSTQTGNAANGTPTFNNSNAVFTFRQGFVLQAPAGGGAAIQEGETFTVNGTTFTMTKTGNTAAGFVDINNSMSANDVAAAIYSAVLSNPLTLTAPATGGLGVQEGETFTIDGVTFQLTKTGSVTSGNIAVKVDDTMTAANVASAVNTAVISDSLGLSMPASGGFAVQSGETFTVNSTIFEFTKTGSVAAGHVAVNITSNMTAAALATAIKNAVSVSGVTPQIDPSSSSIVRFVGATTLTQSPRTRSRSPVRSPGSRPNFLELR